MADQNQLKTTVRRTGGFALFSAYRVSSQPNHIDIVIEGDGLAWIDYNTPSDNPTPEDPIGLNIAAHIRGDVIYLARPCQYIAPACTDIRYWTSHRYAPEILHAYMTVLDQIRHEYPDARLNLIGYSGGAYITLILAEQRQDIERVTTVAGLLDADAWTAYHDISPLVHISPVRSNPSVSYTHICGAEDEVIPCALVRKFVKVQEQQGMTNHELQSVRGANHETLWSFVFKQ